MTPRLTDFLVNLNGIIPKDIYARPLLLDATLRSARPGYRHFVCFCRMLYRERYIGRETGDDHCQPRRRAGDSGACRSRDSGAGIDTCCGPCSGACRRVSA